MPNCLVSEKHLVHSVELYVESLERMTGGSQNALVAEKMMQIIPERYRQYDKMAELGEVFETYQEQIGKDMVHSALEGLETIKSWMVSQRVYCDQYATAYNLKWILRNNPTVRYKYAPKVSLGIFSSVSLFTYYGEKYVGCTANIDGVSIFIHLCCSQEGLKYGPYLLESVFESGVTDRQLLDAGFVKGDRSRPTVYPMEGFDLEKTDLPELAKHIEQMAKKVLSLIPSPRLHGT